MSKKYIFSKKKFNLEKQNEIEIIKEKKGHYIYCLYNKVDKQNKLEIDGSIFFRCCENIFLNNLEELDNSILFDFFSNKYKEIIQISKNVNAYIWIFSKIIKLIGKKKEDIKGVILDLGAGHGFGNRSLYSINEKYNNIRIINADISNEMLMNLRSREIKLNIDCLTIPLRRKSVDIVICVFLFHYIQNIRELFNELSRIIKNNGFLGIIYYKYDRRINYYQKLIQENNLKVIYRNRGFFLNKFQKKMILQLGDLK